MKMPFLVAIIAIGTPAFAPTTKPDVPITAPKSPTVQIQQDKKAPSGKLVIYDRLGNPLPDYQDPPARVRIAPPSGN
jgi:hypothetical protein